MLVNSLRDIKIATCSFPFFKVHPLKANLSTPIYHASTMKEETKTFISCVRRHEEQISTKPSLSLINAIQILKMLEDKTSETPDRIEVLEFLFKVMVLNRGPPSASDAWDNTLNLLLARLKSLLDQDDAKHALCDILADLEIRSWNKVDKVWDVDWPTMTC